MNIKQVFRLSITMVFAFVIITQLVGYSAQAATYSSSSIIRPLTSPKTLVTGPIPRPTGTRPIAPNPPIIPVY